MKEKTESIVELRGKALVHLAAAVAACHHRYSTSRADRNGESAMRKVAELEGEFACRALLVATAPDVKPDILRRLIAHADEMREKYETAGEPAERQEPECAIRRVTKITIE